MVVILTHWTYDGCILRLRGGPFACSSAVAGVWEGRTVYQASSNLKKSTAGIEKYSARNHTMFSFIPPGAGMYL
ncbi:uncharacterized protein F5891DRAFT_1000687 [Suillus fuscotomentosus]|uniref:Uncharacterized protein n=1 Tax=Suillus fuscotomentosus TaxID=1912939 RepID=A0AAD4HSD1_9AGAM|nr:uncharacterized protein F5891DRAFT_1000687 [Suillus fuscotomentosus]KAG1907243.1 hypothetical protein F5891DRAFT_1000687 [Suillus fuscotomentosus]